MKKYFVTYTILAAIEADNYEDAEEKAIICLKENGINTVQVNDIEIDCIGE